MYAQWRNTDLNHAYGNCKILWISLCCCYECHLYLALEKKPRHKRSLGVSVRPPTMATQTQAKEIICAGKKEKKEKRKGW